MKKIKKVISIALCGVIAGTTAISLAACGGREDIVSDGKTLNVRIYKAGYGDEYFTAWSRAFEDIYSTEGYKINVVEATTAVQANQVTDQLAMGNKNGIDLYLAGNAGTANVVAMSKQEGFTIAEDLTQSVMNAKPIGADGVEENVTVLEKLKVGYDYLTLMNSDNPSNAQYNGKWFTMPIFSSPSSLIVNVPLLESYGYSIPLTTNDLLTQFKGIKEGNSVKAGSATTGVYPTCWAGGNAYRYWDCTYGVWFAQYAGREGFYKFVNLDGVDLTSKEEITALYKDKGLYSAIKLMETMMDLNNAPNGTATMMHGTAQHNLLSDKAVFMANGTWLQNEMSTNYKDKVSSMKMISMPVVSELGIKLQLDGKGGTDADLCESVLKKVIAMADDGASTESIIASVNSELGVSLTSEQVEEVKTARGLYYNGGVTIQMIINPFSKVKDIAVKFLRFTASDMGIMIANQYAGAISAYNPVSDLTFNTTPFLDSVNQIAEREGADSVFLQGRPGSPRSELGLNFMNATIYGAVDWMKTMADQRGSMTADDLLNEELKTVLKRLNLN